MSRKRFLALPALVLAVGLVAGPADASRQDSWLGHPFMWHVNDVIAYPHRASMDDWQNAAAAVYVPEESNAGGSPSAESGLLQGTATFGRDNWGIIIAGNDNRGYNPVKALGTHERRPAEYLVNPTSYDFSAYGLSGSVEPKTRLQLGLGYGLDAVALGLFWTNAADKLTVEQGDPVIKTGEEASYNSFTVSANLNTLSAFRSFELGLSFTTGSQEIFGDPDNTGTGPGSVGTGDNSAFAVTWQAHLDTEWVGWTPAFQFTYGQCSADFTEALDPGETGTAPETKLDDTVIRADFGGTRSWGNARVATNIGLQTYSSDFEANSGGATPVIFKDEDSWTVFPVCGASGEYWPRGWFGLDGGVLFAFNDFESKNDVGGTPAGPQFENQDLMTEFGFGFVFRIDRDDWRADFAANVRNDVLGNPGQIVQGGNDGNPIFAIESSLYW